MSTRRKITIMETPAASLFVYPEKRIVHHTVHKFIYGEDFRNLMTKGADIFIKHKCNKWLSDDRSNSALKKEDVEWGQKNWENRILEKGWEYWALVMPEKTVGKMNMQKIVERYKSKGVEVKIFSDVDEGFEWLTTK